MSIANSIAKTVAFDREASFCSGTDWDAMSSNGGLIALTEIDDTNIRQAVVPNANLKQRSGASRAPIPSLLSEAAASAKSYQYGGSANADAGSQAARILKDEFLLVGLGGENRGFAAAMTGGSAAAPEVVTGQGANVLPWSWGFFYDVDESRGYFRQIASVSTDTLTMAPGHELPFTPADEDPMHAVVAHYPDWDVLEDHANAGHHTLTFLIKGKHTEDGFYLRGCTVTIEFETIEAGAQTQFDVSIRCVEFDHEDILAMPALPGAVQGRPDSIVGRGVATMCDMADFGGELVVQQFWGAITPRLGIEKEPVMGPNGREGVHGYGVTEGSHDASTLEMSVPFSSAWSAEFRAQTRKHVLIQVGDQPGNAWGLYFPHLAYSEEPQKAPVGGRAGSALRFLVQERPTSVENPTHGVDVSGMSASVIQRALAKFYILRAG